jgi:oligopeptide/dipeptide ABC transporter ATP-binding protein
MPVLTVENLEVSFGPTRILRGVSLESGCGKSMTGFAIMGMLPGPGKVTGGSIRLGDRELTSIRRREWSEIRGKQIALVMQDPFTSLNPMMRIGHQVAEVFMLHEGMSRDRAWKESVTMIDQVGIPAPESSARKYPHQLSGGQRQRVVIAMAFACKPKVLIADEPTTALDVTLQAQILRLIEELKSSVGTAVMLISHDIGVIGSLASSVAVFYAGAVVERGPAETVLLRPEHPYTKALLEALPRKGQKKLASISGQPPDLAKLPPGCAFAPRCPFRFEKCEQEPSLLSVAADHHAACWKAAEAQAQLAVTALK